MMKKQTWFHLGGRRAALGAAGLMALLVAPPAEAAAPAAAPAQKAADNVEKTLWMTDFKAAQALAAKEKKPLLVSFSGSDWCGWCIKLDKEVFHQPEFAKWAAEHFVMFQADFPRRAPQSRELKMQNAALAEQFRVEGFPTVVLLRPDGRAFATTGYRPGGAKAYIAHLQELQKNAGL